jgi:hypothetical protein
MTSELELTNRVIERVVARTGLDRAAAARFVDAATAGAKAHVLEVMSGSTPIASTIVAHRAEVLRFVCTQLGRFLTEPEVAVLFRVQMSQARAILRSAAATYSEVLEKSLLTSMRTGVSVLATGTDRDGLSWTLTFDEASGFETALAELRRQGLGRQLTVAPGRRIVVPRIDDPGRDALAILKIPAPRDR